MTKTELLYMTDAYLKQTTATVVDVEDAGKQTYIILDKTIFYPQGGGQPADQGTITGPSGTLTVTHVSYNGGAIQHKGKLDGNIKKGDTVELRIDWPLRYYHMQLHTSGHILDQAVKNTAPGVIAVDGDHGIGKRAFVELNKEIDSELKHKIEDEANKIVQANHPVSFKMMTKNEMLDAGIKLPFDLPSNKPLRIMGIGDFPPMPDGGTHLKSSGESWPIKVIDIIQKKGAWRVLYSVEKSEEKPKPTETSAEGTTSNPISDEVNQLKAELRKDVKNGEESVRTKYLGKKGLFNQLAKSLKDLAADERKAAGQALNQCKIELETMISQAEQTAATQHTWVDLTMPGTKPEVGHMHPVSQAMEEITRIFDQIGFTRVRYPEVDWDWYVFESLNMSPDHPARDEWETFFIDLPDTTKDVSYDEANPRKRHPSKVGGKVVMSTHTSNGQVREMERLDSKPPIRMINIARCYRRQQDATHTQMFHQFEGLVVDKGINIQHLKGTLDYFAEQFYGPGTKSRIRPFHFQFTEPSFEVDFSCHICHGSGKVSKKDLEPNDPRHEESGEMVKCKFCKSGWHEVGGAGMVHPNVLKAGGIDPDEYTGFAFGWGIERTYTLKQGLNIDDIRLFYSGDLRFLEQF